MGQQQWKKLIVAKWCHVDLWVGSEEGTENSLVSIEWLEVPFFNIAMALPNPTKEKWSEQFLECTGWRWLPDGHVLRIPVLLSG